MYKSKSPLIIALLMAIPFGAQGHAETAPCDPSSGRVSTRIQCLAKLTQLFSEQMESLRTEVARSSSQAESSGGPAKLSELDQRMASLETQLQQYAKSSDVDKLVNTSDLGQQLSALQSGLAKYATRTDLSTYAKISDLNQRTASLQSEFHQYAKAEDLDSYVKTSDLNAQLTALKSELTKRPRWEEFYKLESNLQLEQPSFQDRVDTHSSASKPPASDVSADAIVN